jgi:hypothetical protein
MQFYSGLCLWSSFIVNMKATKVSIIPCEDKDSINVDYGIIIFFT